MKPLITLALVVAAVPALAQAPKWTPYAAKADGFTVLVPGPTQIQNQSTQGVKTNIYISMARPFVCAVSKTMLPANIKPSDIAQLKAAMKSSMLATSRSTATGEKAATYSGYSGEQTAFKTAAGGTGATWIAQKGRTVYSLTIVKQGGASSAEISRFLNSFRAR